MSEEADRQWWHAYAGPMPGSATAVVVAGPTPIGVDDDLRVRQPINNLAYMWTFDHEPTEAEKNAILTLAEGAAR